MPRLINGMAAASAALFVLLAPSLAAANPGDGNGQPAPPGQTQAGQGQGGQGQGGQGQGGQGQGGQGQGGQGQGGQGQGGQGQGGQVQGQGGQGQGGQGQGGQGQGGQGQGGQGQGGQGQGGQGQGGQGQGGQGQGGQGQGGQGQGGQGQGGQGQGGQGQGGQGQGGQGGQGQGGQGQGGQGQGGQGQGNKAGGQEHVTICHATGSEKNPFVVIGPAEPGVVFGHLGDDHQNGEDIIPPFEYEGQTYSQNWGAEGQAILEAGCVGDGSTPLPPPPDGKGKHTICHATGSEKNPFVVITPDIEGVFNGHLGDDHQNGEDIIPPFEYEGQTYSQNWDAEGQALFEAGCVDEEASVKNPPTEKAAPPAGAGQPGGPGESGVPGESDESGGALAFTGANIGLIALIAALAAGAGWFLLRMRPKA